MASYFIFPSKDTTLYSLYPSMNTGKDEILEITTQTSPFDETSLESSRILIQFPSNEINDIITNKIGSASWNANLRLFLANASEIPLDYSIFAYPLSQSWNMGTGKYLDSPLTTNGAGWTFSQQSGSNIWQTGSFNVNATASYIGTNYGGGVWLTSSLATQSFTYIDEKDINMDVTSIVHAWQSGSIFNNGFILKLQDSLEFNSGSYLDLKYFSMDTHTIYPPALEIKWNDFLFSTGSSAGTYITDDSINISLGNNKNEYQQNSVQKFRINVRPKFPVRTFQTSSVYLTNYYLPQSSSYAIKNLDTEENVIDFDDVYTKISADSTSNYFNIYMNGLQPEKYYKILIKTNINGEILIFDNDYYFKVIR